MSGHQGFARVCPLERLGPSAVEVFDKGQDAFFELFHRGEAGAFEQAADGDTEPQFNLVEPRGAFGRIHETNAVPGIGQEVGAGGARAQDPAASLLAQILIEIAQNRHQVDQGFGWVRVEVVDDEDPFALQIAGHRLQQVVGELLLAARGGHRRGQDATGGDLEVGDQIVRAVADVVRLLPLDKSGDRRLGGMQALQCLHAGLLVATDQMHPLLVQRQGLFIQGTDRGHLVAKPLRVLRLRVEPGADPMRLKIRLILKNAPPYAPKCWTRRSVLPPLRPPLGGSSGTPDVASPRGAHRRWR